METTDNNNIQQLERLREQVKKQEKMASLGVLSAGVIHEIQNPLNFVINFSKMSNSLLTDLQEIIDDNKDKLAANDQEEISDIMNDLNENLSKIAEHGNRAISIIRNILLYSRGKEDEYIPTDICKLTKEYVWLSYHSMRANYQGFNVTINENYQKDIPMITVVPQDFSRAVLNVMNNACYAVWNKAQNLTDDADTYHPTISVDVKVEGNELNTTITDNGEGMTEEVKQKLFDTFFTTKPVGHGTGLGMSITRQIIEEKHHGRIEFDSKRGEFTTFSLIIPIKK
jgi:two-component system NtrC family sensor kinase